MSKEQISLEELVHYSKGVPPTAQHIPISRCLRWFAAALALWSGPAQAISPPCSPGWIQDSPEQALKKSSLAGYSYIRTGIRTRQHLPVAKPAEQVLLTLERRTRRGNIKRLTLTYSQLLALPTLRYKATQLQLGRAFTYDGVPLRDLAELGGFVGKDLRIYASNGFVVTIPASEYLQNAIMLAHTANGQPISVLQKGPLEVVLPPEQRFVAKEYGSYWVWFVARIAPAP